MHECIIILIIIVGIAMDIEVVAEGLSKELVKEKPLIQCWQVAQVLRKTLKQRERTITILTEAANSLDLHSRNSSIAKTVGGTAGVSGKVAFGVGLAAILGAPLTGGISAAAGIACLAAGGAVGGLGMATEAGTYMTESILCAKEIAKAKKAIEKDQGYVKRLLGYWAELECMFEGFCKIIPKADMSKVLHAVSEVFNAVKEFVSSSSVNWEAISKIANSKSVKSVKEKVVDFIKPIIVNAYKTVTSVALNSISSLRGGMVAAIGIGAVLLSLDIIVLFRNAVSLATSEGHPDTAEIRSTIEKLEDERDDLKAFGVRFQYHLQSQEEECSDQEDPTTTRSVESSFSSQTYEVTDVDDWVAITVSDMLPGSDMKPIAENEGEVLDSEYFSADEEESEDKN